ncbi:hypothetical protein L208DRAFT_1488584, partial [Tricholoma matsutake]
MSSQFHEETISDLHEGKIWGLLCTDVAGMGLDIPDIKLIIQWSYIPSMCTLIQRFGRDARNHLLEVTAIYVVEPKYLNSHAKKVDPTLK